MNKEALVGLFLTLFLVLALSFSSVSAVDNRDIALYPIDSSGEYLVPCESGMHVGVDTFNFEPISDEAHNWPSSILVDENGTRYQTKAAIQAFHWGCDNVNITVSVPVAGVWGFYLMRASDESSQEYDVYVDGVLVASYNLNLNFSGSLIPLYNISSPDYLSKGEHIIMVDHLSSIDGNRKFGYNYVVGVKIGNASVSTYNISYDSTLLYHSDPTVSVEVNLNSTMEISSVEILLNGQYKQTLTKSGLFNMNASGVVDTFDLMGEVNMTVNITDTYGYENISNYTLTISNSSDVGISSISCPDSASVGSEFTCNIGVRNTGTVNSSSSNVSLYVRSNTPIYIGSFLVDLPANTNKTVSLTISEWPLELKKQLGYHRFDIRINGSAGENLDDNTYLSNYNVFRVVLANFLSGGSLSRYVPLVEFFNSTDMLWANATNETVDTVSPVCFDTSFCILRFYYNLENLTADGKDPTKINIKKLNETSGEYFNVTDDLPWVNNITINTTGKYINLNASSFSVYTIDFGDIVEHTPSPSTTPSSISPSYGGGSSYSPSVWTKFHEGTNNAIVVCEGVDCVYGQMIIDNAQNSLGFRIMKASELTKRLMDDNNLILIGGREANNVTDF